MTRPQMVRADTLDLQQDQKTPSAQDHSRQLKGSNRIASHHDQSLRNAEQETREEMLQSPRVSADLNPAEDQQGELNPYDHSDGTNGHEDALQDNNAGQYNGRGTIIEDGEYADGESDDGLDDDMMDRISSSPSIDDEDHHHGRYPGPIGQTEEHARYPPQDYHDLRTTSKLGKRNFNRFAEEFNEDEDDSDLETYVDALDHLLLPVNDLLPPYTDSSYDIVSHVDREPLDPRQTFDPHSGISDTVDDDTKDISFSDDTRFVDSGLGGECLQDIEDIDFEFVYALHTFVATVEGQANATKGDTMVLLDDSNSYWWLVRVVKDGSIGYLPAEHIETPTERLARLNKHRNIDLSATMLGDNAEKSKNPLKKAMRRRNAKTVTFSSPTYFEASDVEFSTDEEEDGDEQFFEDEDGITQDTHEESTESNENMTVEPLRLKSRPDAVASIQEEETTEEPASPEKERTSEEIIESQPENVSRSRNGVVRNTDSFFKDDSVETKKISLTPNLLRDDSNNTDVSSEPKELKGRASLESVEKSLSAGDKSKEEKKRKEKKSNMLSGLFKRKDKKSKNSEEEYEDVDKDKVSEESSRSSPQPKTSSESIPEGVKSPKQQAAPQRQTSKLQKAPPPEMSPVKSEHPIQPSVQHPSGSTPSSPIKEEAETSVRSVGQEQSAQNGQQSVRVISPEESSRDAVASPVSITSPEQPSNGNSLSPVKTTFLNSSISSLDFPKPSDKSPTETLGKAPSQTEGSISQRSLAESPVDVSPVAETIQGPPGLVADTSTSDSPVSPPSSSPVDATNDPKADDATPTSTSASFSNPTWNDSHLRTYLEDASDLRDLVIIVHDKSNVPPTGPDHPVTGSLFKEENKKLSDMSSRLDDMLSGWLARKTRAN